MSDSQISEVPLPYVDGMEITVPEGVIAHCGVPRSAAVSGTYTVVCDPLFPPGALLDVLTLEINGLKTSSARYEQPEDVNKPVRLTAPAGYLLNGDNKVKIIVTRGSQNVGESGVLVAHFHQDGPAGSDLNPGDGSNATMQFDVEEDAKDVIGPELAKRGLKFYLFYPLMRWHDRIRLFYGNQSVVHKVTKADAAQSTPQTPLVIVVPEATVLAAGDGTIKCRCIVNDWIGNAPTPEPASRTLELRAAVITPLSDKPVLTPQSSPGIIDLGELNGDPVIATMHARAPWEPGDVLRMIASYLDANGQEQRFEKQTNIPNVPSFPAVELANDEFTKAVGRSVAVYYEQMRNGVSLGRSYVTRVLVTGSAQIVLTPLKLVAPAVNPIDPGLYPQGVTVRAEHLLAKPGDEALLEIINPDPGSPAFLPVPLNQNKRANFKLDNALLEQYRGRILRLRWYLIRGGVKTPSPPLRLTIQSQKTMLAFDVDDYALAPGGRTRVGILVSENGAGVANRSVDVTLPSGLSYTDGGTGLRTFITDVNGQIQIADVKAGASPGFFTLTATHAGLTETAQATVKQVALGQVTGIAGAFRTKISNDGTHGYATGSLSAEGTGVLTKFDTITLEISYSRLIGGYLRDLVLSANSLHVYVIRNRAGANGNAIIELDANTLEVTRSLDLNNLAPTSIALSENQRFAYIGAGTDPSTGFPNSRMAVINLAAFTLDHVTVLQNNAAGVAINPNGRVVYVANANGNGGVGADAGSISFVNTADYSVTNHLGVGSNPHDITVSPDGRLVYTVRTEGKLLVVIDALTNTVFRNIPLGISAWCMALSDDGRFLCASEWNPGQAIAIVDTTNFSVRLIPSPQYTAGVAFSRDGRRVFFCNSTQNKIVVVEN
ncbi:YncE family protein [Pseudomonas syringae]